MDAAQIEEDVDREQVLWVGTSDPVRDARAPGRLRTAPGRVLRHHAAGAIGDAGLVQDVGDLRAERREPTILGAVRFTFGEHDGVVLVHREQALAAPGRAEHRERVRARRRAPAGLGHALLGQQRGTAGHGAEFARDHGRDLAARQAFAREAGRDLRRDPPRRSRDR